MSTPNVTSPAGFTWPPRDGRAQAAPEIVIVRPRARPDFARWLRPGPAWWAELERAFLAPTHEPVPRRAAELGWWPDDAEMFCPRCAGTAGPHEITPILGPGSPLGCRECRDHRPGWTRSMRLGPYDGPLREWIHELKFERFRPAGWTLGRLMGERLKAELIAAGVEPARVVLVPVPMSRWRRMSRGIDHTLALARGVREVTGAPIARTLARLHRPSQIEVPASQRRANVAKAFRARRLEALDGRLVVMIDDVRTTGATLAAACRALRRGMKMAARRRGGTGDGPARRGDLTMLGRVEIWTLVAGVTPRPEEKAGPAKMRAGIGADAAER